MSRTVSHVDAAGDTATPDNIPWPLELEPDAVRERFRQARRAGRPRYLWPDVDPAAWRAALHELTRVTAEVLAGRKATIESRDARATGIAGFTSGMGPLLGYWLERGEIEAGEPERTLLLLHLEHGRRRVRVQRSLFRRVRSTLAERAIEPTVLKSAATASMYFPEPGVRPGIDIDLVVQPSEFDQAEHALRTAGLERVGAQVAPRKSDWRSPDIPPWPRSLELLHSGAQYGIDLHDSLTRDFFGIRRVTIEGDTEPGGPAGDPMRVLAQPARLAYHALHAAEGLDNLTLVRLVEIVLMVRRDMSDSRRWQALVDELQRSGAARFVWPAFALADRLAPGTVDPDTLRALERASTTAMRSVVSTLNPADAQRLDVLTLRERFMWCRGARDHARRLAHMLLPAPAGRSPGRLARLYANRAWRVFRRTIVLRRAEPDQSDD